MELYGRALGTLESRAYSGQKNQPAIDRPYLTLLALSVPHHVVEAVTNSDVVNGFLNRFLIFQEPGGAFIDEPPARFSDELQRRCETLAEASHIKARLEHNADKGPRAVEGLNEVWATLPTDEARDHLLAFRRECFENQTEQGHIGNMWARTYENAVRVAGNVAIGCYDGARLNPELTLEHADWATRLVCKLTIEACRLIEGEVADSPTERDVKRMFKFVCDAVSHPRQGRWYDWNKAGLVSRAQITSAFWRIDKWRRDQILETLVEGGEIEEVAVQSQGGNSPQLFRPRVK
jgi:hypothetical protein